MNERAFSDILAADTRGAEIEEFLERRTEPLAILFVDLCGSSALKQRPQRQWLPIVCRFLYEITQQIVRQEGRVVKYIGDEVMAVFEEQTGRPAALRAMAAIQQSDAYIRSLGSEYVAKFAADFGDATRVDIGDGPWDVLGMVVDRCARIAKVPTAGTAVASQSFVAQLAKNRSWRSLGTVRFRGISAPTEVFQLSGMGPDLAIVPRAFETDPADLVRELEECRTELTAARKR
jgi:class 3 adenylate cyclase